MAIDIGSDSYKIALTRPGNYMELVLNTESNRKSLNSVGFSPNERFVGDNAQSSARKFPKSTFRHPQFLLGHNYDSNIVNLYHERFPLANLKKNDTTGNVIFSAENFKEDFSPEALLSMIMTDAQMSASVFAKSDVKNLAVVVRAFTDQTQRLYYKKSAQISRMNLVEIVDSNVATGIKYLVAKYGKIPKGLHNVMIVDVGSYHTDATIYSCQELYENKNKKKPYPTCTIIGYGYTFKGVGDIDSKIVDIIIKKFELSTNTIYNTIATARRNFTLFEEAKRIKKVLTSVPQTKIQLESFYRDEDFISTINVSELESQCKDYVESMLDAIDQSLKSSNKTTSDLSQVVLMGGGSRIPMIQSMIKQKTKTDRLSNVLNTDEDGVLGATFILAGKSNYFKVKKIVLHKAAVYPIVACYNKTETTNTAGNGVGTTTEQHTVEKVIYKHMQPITQGKVLTIKNVTDDFTVVLKYGTIPEFYDQSSIATPPETKHNGGILHTYDIKGLKETIEKHQENYNFDMIKVHVSFNELGIVSITSAEAIFVKKEGASTFDKIKEKVSNLFSNKKKDTADDDNNKQIDEASNSTAVVDGDGDDTNNSTTTKNVAQNNTTNSTETNDNNNTVETDSMENNNATTTILPPQNATINANATVVDEPAVVVNNTNKKTTPPPPKKQEKLDKIVKSRLHVTKNHNDTKILPADDDNEIFYYREKIRLIRKKEVEQERNAAAMSKLESFINDSKYKLESGEKFAEVVNEEERSKLIATVEEKSAWFEEHGYLSNATINNRVHRELNDTLVVVHDRIYELDFMENLASSSPTLVERMQQFIDLINNSSVVVKNEFNMTSFDEFVYKVDQLKNLTTIEYEAWTKVKPWEAKPFNSTDVANLIKLIHEESVFQITTFSKVTKEIERKLKDEEKKKKAAEKSAKKDAAKKSDDQQKQADKSDTTTEEPPLNVNNNTTFANATTTTPSPDASTTTTTPTESSPSKDEL